jgi:fructose-1,6-bisphosphatase/inositol monophosphatase family enzyme
MRTKPVPTSARLEQVAIGAAHAANRIHLRRLSRIKVARKSNAIDLVTEADGEQTVIRTLNRAFADHAILAEESGANAGRSEHRWIIDPLDGTANLAHGFPQFCVAGSAVLDLCYVARGRVDALWEFGLRSWDIAAGALAVAVANSRSRTESRGELELR